MEAQEKYRREIDLQDGSGVQVFEADTETELIDKLTQAQEHATRRIRELNRAIKVGPVGEAKPDPIREVHDFSEKPLTADEQYAIAQELQDPTKARSGVKKLIESEFGASVEEVRATLRQSREMALQQQVIAAGNAFMAENPSYEPCKENEETMFAYLQKNNMASTKNNFQIAFNDLQGTGLIRLKEKEEKEVPAEERIAPVRRSTGLRPQNSSAVSDKPKPKITWDEINKMPSQEYAQRIRTDAAFKEAVDSLPPPR